MKHRDSPPLLLVLLLACGGSTVGDGGDATIDHTGLDVAAETTSDAAPLDGASDAASDSTPCVGPKPPGLLAWWKGENNLNDELGAVPLTGTASYSPGEVGYAFDQDASPLHGTASPALDGLSALTIEGWIYVRSWPSQVIITRRYNTGYQFEVDGALSFAVGCGASNCVASSTTLVALNKFTHVAVTYDPTSVSGGIQFYVDGAAAGSGPGNGDGGIPDDLPTVYVGSIHTGVGYFDGIIDELSVYNRVLTPSEIAAIYAAGTKGKCK